MDFYEELIASIKELIEAKKYEEARNRINEELLMPYVPGYVMEELQDFLDELDYLSPRKEDGLTVDEAIMYLKSDDIKYQFLAANYFDRLNIRDYLDVIEENLQSDKVYDDVKVALVSTLINQEIKEEIKMNKEGVEYKFIPYYVIKVEDSDGYLKALEIFKEEFYKNPSYYNMAVELFTSQAYKYLPLNIEEQEGADMAHNIIKYIYRLFEEDKTETDGEQILH